jgi:Skp family chaperone for outer membrane proteins
MEEVGEKSVVAQGAKKQMTELKTRLEDALVKRQQVALLTDEQRKELEKLLAKTPASDADKARIAELQAGTEKLEKELLELNQKPNPSEAESARIKDLTARMASARQQMTTEQAQAQKELNENMVKTMSTLQDRIFKAIEEVAKDRGLAMVVHKEARLFGGEDITDAVISKLKK